MLPLQSPIHILMDMLDAAKQPGQPTIWHQFRNRNVHPGSPLVFPWWAQVHIFFGFGMFFWVITPIMYYINVQ